MFQLLACVFICCNKYFYFSKSCTALLVERNGDTLNVNRKTDNKLNSLLVLYEGKKQAQSMKSKEILPLSPRPSTDIAACSELMAQVNR